MKGSFLVLGLLFVLAACGGGDSGDDGAAPATVSSPDGKAVLTLSEGSLPEGVEPDDLQIDWAEGLSDEPGAPGVAVRLVPDGLVFDKAASLRVELPDGTGDEVVFTHVSADGFTFNDGVIEEVEGVRFLTTDIDHFSSITIHGVAGLTTLIADATPDAVTVDQAQLVSSEVWLEAVPLVLWIPVGTDSKKSQMYTFDDIRFTETNAEHSGVVMWNEITGDDTAWDPPFTFALDTADDAFVAFDASSTCAKANSIDPFISNAVDLTMDLTAKGAVIDQTLIVFGRSVGQEFATASSKAVSDDGKKIPFSAAVGATVEGRVVVMGSVESECAASSGGTTTTTTAPVATTTTAGTETGQVPPGQDPRAHVVGIDPVATENSTIGLSVRFAEPWGMEPPFDLFSFFVLFNILQGNLSVLAGWEVHDEVVTPYGSGPTLLMPDGSMLIDTGFPIGPGTPIEVAVENGSWPDETTTQPVFNQLTFQIDPSEPLPPIDEDDAVWDLVSQTPFPNGGPP